MTEPEWLQREQQKLGQKTKSHALKQLYQTGQTPAEAGIFSTAPSSKSSGKPPVVLAAEQNALPNKIISSPEIDTLKTVGRQNPPKPWLERIRTIFKSPGVS